MKRSALILLALGASSGLLGTSLAGAATAEALAAAPGEQLPAGTPQPASNSGVDDGALDLQNGAALCRSTEISAALPPPVATDTEPDLCFDGCPCPGGCSWEPLICDDTYCNNKCPSKCGSWWSGYCDEGSGCCICSIS